MTPNSHSATPASTSTELHLKPPFSHLGKAAWVLIALLVLGLNLGAGPQRYSELLTVCPTAECPYHYTQAQVDGIRQLGFEVWQWLWVFEGMSLLLTLGSLIPAAIIYWRRPTSVAAFIASLFLVVVGNVATLNWGAAGRMGIPLLAGLQRLAQPLGGIFVALLFYLFPNGHFVPRWTKWVVAGWIAYQMAGALLPGTLIHIDSWSSQLADLLAFIVYLGGVAAQVYRYRRASTPVERQQTKWVVAAFALQVLTFAAFSFRPSEPPRLYHLGSLIGYAVYVSTFLLIPIAFIFSILRYRLWDIDFLLNRSMVYGALTLVLMAAFAGSAFVLQALFAAVTAGGQASLALALAMLVVGILFQPTRQVVRDFVDRRIYGIQVDYERAIREYSRLRKVVAVNRPTSLGDYGHLELIGRGGMAEVYRAIQPGSGRVVAVKVLPPVLATRSVEYRHRFVREARALAELHHPNIVKLLDYGVTDTDMPYMVLEYVEGADLEEYLDRVKKLSLAEFSALVRDVAAALDYAHAEGLVHRDIKPSNVLLAPATGANGPFRAVLTDFGIAKVPLATRLTTSNIIGTIDYIAPEQIEGLETIDRRADVYALGVTAYEAITGQRPFKGTSPVAVIIAHLEQPPPDPRKVNKELPVAVAQAIVRAMAKDPEARFATAGEFAAALGARPV